MSPEPAFTDYIAGPTSRIAAFAANYQCGHCNSVTTPYDDEDGNPHLAIEHDDGCPVLSGAVSSLPDTLRAAAKVPDTFRP